MRDLAFGVALVALFSPVLSGCGSASNALPSAGPVPSDSGALSSFETRLADATTRRDRTALNAMIADDWTITLASGARSNKTRALLRWTMPRDSDVVADTAFIDSLEVRRVGGDAAVLTAAITDITTRASAAETVRTRVTDVVVRRGDQWQLLVSHESVRAPTTVTAKPIPVKP